MKALPYRLNINPIEYNHSLDKIKQELIAEIKNIEPHYTIDGSGMDSEITKAILIKELIGDNQE